MNPEKLFAYLDGRLPNDQRAEIDQRLETDAQLQRELAMAREIHMRARGDTREVIFEDEMAASAHGRKMALRVGVAAIALIVLNVVVGLLFIARKEASNPNRKLLEQQMREQLRKSLGQAATNVLTPPALDINDITIPVARGKSGAMADQVVAIAQRLGGSATKELPDNGRIGVLVDLAANREAEFRAAIATLVGAAPPSPNESPSEAKKSFVVQIVEQ